MANLGVTDRLLARPDAVEKVLHVVIADIQPLRARRQRRRNQIRIARFDFAARDKNPATVSFEFYTVLLPILVDHRAVPRISRRSLANQLDAIVVFIVDRVLAVSREAPLDHLDERLGLDTHRPAAIMPRS